MTGRLAYLLRFVAVTFGSFLLGKTLFVLYNHKLSGTMSLGDFLGVLFHGASLDLAVVGYLISLPLLVVLVSYAFTSFPARRVLLAYHLLISAILALVFVGDTALYPFWGFKLDGTVFLYLDSPKNAFASVPLGFTLLGGSSHSSGPLGSLPSYRRARLRDGSGAAVLYSELWGYSLSCL